MLKVAQSGKSSLPLGSQTLMKKRYMDDIGTASNDENFLIRIKKETSQLLGNFGFEIKEWLSNNEKVGKMKEDMKILGDRYNVKNENLYPTLGIPLIKKVDKTKYFIVHRWNM